MADNERVILHIPGDLEILGRGQIGYELSPDTDLGFPMWGGKDAEGGISKFLAKGKPAEVKSLTVADFKGTGNKFIRTDNDGRVTETESGVGYFPEQALPGGGGVQTANALTGQSWSYTSTGNDPLQIELINSASGFHYSFRLDLRGGVPSSLGFEGAYQWIGSAPTWDSSVYIVRAYKGVDNILYIYDVSSNYIFNALYSKLAPPFPSAIWPSVDSVPIGTVVYSGGKTYQVGKKTCKFINQAEIPHYYCDSVLGSDSNDGLTVSTPKKTVSAVVALANGPCVFEFARGSYFREQLTVPFNASVVKAYGTGDRPIFDCADIVSGFTKTGGLTNVYQFTLNSNLTIAGKCKNSMWFDDIRMIRATSQAECDSIAGSFYSSISYTGTDTIYFHSPESVDPNSDGHVYTSAARLYGVEQVGYLDQTGTGEIYSIHTARNGGNNGSLLGSKYTYDCYAYDGTVHNVWNGGIAESCIGELFEPTAIGNATAFVSFISTPTPDTSYRYTDCSFVGITSELYGWKQISAPAYYCHTDDDNDKINHVLYENCVAENVGTFGGGIANNIVFYKSEALNTYEGFNGTCDKLTMLSGKTSWKSSLGATNWAHRRSLSLANAKAGVLKGLEFAHNYISGGMIYVLNDDSEYDIKYSTFYSIGAFSTSKVIDKIRSTASLLDFSNNIVKVTPSRFYDDPLNGTLVGDKNLFNITTECKGRLNGVTYNNLSELQALNSSNLNSVTGDPLFTGDPSLGDFSIDPLSPANAIDAGSSNYVVTVQDLQYMSVLNEL